MKTNSLINNLMLDSRQPTPEVGMGATICGWTDRHACTVVAVRHFKTGARKGQVSEVDVQEDTATRTDGNGMSESQAYTFSPNPNGRVSTHKVRKDGTFDGLMLGSRSEYYDYSF